MAGRSKGRGGNAASPPPPPSFEPSQLCITLPPARCNGPQWAPTAPNGPQCISPSIPGARYTACCACCACCGFFGQVLVAVKAAGLCHSDLSTINGNRPVIRSHARTHARTHARNPFTYFSLVCYLYPLPPPLPLSLPLCALRVPVPVPCAPAHGVVCCVKS